MDDVKTISQEQYEQVLKSYPAIAELYVTIKEFYEIIYSKHEEKLDAWLVKLEKFNIPELQTYVNGIRQDIVAVKMELPCNIIMVWQREALINSK